MIQIVQLLCQIYWNADWRIGILRISSSQVFELVRRQKLSFITSNLVVELVDFETDP